ncbi:hypothetical protein [Pseudonocardia yuanmonensis]
MSTDSVACSTGRAMPSTAGVSTLGRTDPGGGEPNAGVLRAPGP